MKDWYGLSSKGEQRQITHEKLMAWAFEHNMQLSVGWSDHIVIDGTRLVRGPRMVQVAHEQGWHDLADGLRAAFGEAAE